MLRRFAFIAVERDQISISRQEARRGQPRTTWHRYQMEDISDASWQRLNRVVKAHSWLMGRYDTGIVYMSFRKDLTKLIRSARVVLVPQEDQEPEP